MNKVQIIDDGKPEYLDGAKMQFSVETAPDRSEHKRTFKTLAYFGTKEDAEIFVNAKNAALKSSKKAQG